MFKKNVAYVRYSDHNQDDGFSVEYQLTEIQEYCIRQGLDFGGAYIDTAVSGRKVAGREKFFELIHDVKDGVIDTIVVYKFSRMFRNSYESHKFRKLFKKHGVKLVSVTQAIDDETSTGRLMINVLSDIDQFQSETISDHVKSGMREMAKRGYFTGGTIPYGYKTEIVEADGKSRKKYAVEPNEAEFVKEIFSRYANGASLRELQEYLTDSGCFTRQGKQFGITTIARMLRNTFYIGTLTYNTTGYDPVVVENAVTPIIDTDTWLIVQERHKENKLAKPRKRKDLYSLTGKIHCKICGAHFFGCASGSVQRGKKYYYKYYTCANRKNYRSCTCNKVRKDELEKYILRQIKTNILNEKSIKAIAVEVANLCNNTPTEIQAMLKDLHKRKKELEASIETLIDLTLDGSISKEVLARKNSKLEVELSAVLLEIHKLEVRQKSAITVEGVEAYLNKMFECLESIDETALKTLFDNFVESVEIDNEKIALSLRVRPFAPLVDKVASGHPQYTLSTILERE